MKTLIGAEIKNVRLLDACGILLYERQSSKGWMPETLRLDSYGETNAIVGGVNAPKFKVVECKQGDITRVAAEHETCIATAISKVGRYYITVQRFLCCNGKLYQLKSVNRLTRLHRRGIEIAAEKNVAYLNKNKLDPSCRFIQRLFADGATGGIKTFPVCDSAVVNTTNIQYTYTQGVWTYTILEK